MNIAIFTNNYLPNLYGVSTSVEGFRQSLIKAGHTVYIFAPQWGDEEVNDAEYIFRYPSIKAPTKIDFSLVVPYSSKISEVIESLHFDVVHAQHPNLLGSIASKWALKKDVPLIFTWHSLYDRYAHYTPLVPEKFSGKWAMKNAASFAMESDHVIVPTKSIIEVIKKAGVEHNNISVVPSGVDEELFQNPNGEKIRKQYNIEADSIVLTTVSRLSEEKNVVFLAECIGEVLKNNQKAIFLCGGEGDLSDAMKEIFRQLNVLDRVIFAGKVNREDVKDYLDVGDIFVYASTSETQGTIVTENMYIGKPIVAVGQNGVDDLIENGVNGISVKENKKEFIESVQEMMGDDSKRVKIGQNAKKLAKEKYTTTACGKNLLNVYQIAIKNYNEKK